MVVVFFHYATRSFSIIPARQTRRVPNTLSIGWTDKSAFTLFILWWNSSVALEKENTVWFDISKRPQKQPHNHPLKRNLAQQIHYLPSLLCIHSSYHQVSSRTTLYRLEIKTNTTPERSRSKIKLGTTSTRVWHSDKSQISVAPKPSVSLVVLSQ